MLLTLNKAARTLMHTVMESADAYLIVYSNDGVYRDFEPNWPAVLPSATLHLHACTRAKAAIEEDAVDRDPPTVALVTMQPKAYAEYRALAERRGKEPLPDSREARQMWAEAYCKNYRQMEEKE